MIDYEAFAGLKERLLAENEEKYKNELIALYGETRLKRAREHFAALTPEEFARAEKLAVDFTNALMDAASAGDPACEAAREACSIHREWLAIYWGKETLVPEAHLGLAELYCKDSRFAENMEALAEGRAEFFKKALTLYYDV
jgi:hypothetical protein